MGSAASHEFAPTNPCANVRNGVAWDKCDVIEIVPTCKKIILPQNHIKIRREARSTNPMEIFVFTEKRLAYTSQDNPEKELSIETVRNEMKVVKLRKVNTPTDEEFYLSATGAWEDSTGSQTVDILLILHPEFKVEILQSALYDPPNEKAPNPEQQELDLFYNPGLVASTPDPDQTAKGAF